MLKATLQQVLRETCEEHNVSYSRNERWQMFCDVCDNLLNEGTITTIQHERWTSPF